MSTRRYLTDDLEVRNLLDSLVDDSTSPEVYRKDFVELGAKLGEALCSEIPSGANVMLACASEDADFLASGIMSKLHVDKVAVFWHTRIKYSGFDVAPIVSSYIEPMDNCDVLVIAKSIISSSCIVKSQLNCLIDKLNPKTIYIVSPVTYCKAKEYLRREFPSWIYSKFNFVSFAEDAELAENSNIVIPGIGGDVSVRLNMRNYTSINGAVPSMVSAR